MNNRQPSRYLFIGIALTLLGAIGLIGIKTVIFHNLLANKEQRLLLVALNIVVGSGLISYSFWLASKLDDKIENNILNRILSYISRQQGVTVKDIGTSIWGQTLGFIITLLVLIITFAIVWVFLKVFHFAT